MNHPTMDDQQQQQFSSFSNNSSPTSPSITIEKEYHFHNDNNNNNNQTNKKVLKVVMLGCETKVPYGPLHHTGQLLLDMLGMGAMKSSLSSSSSVQNTNDYTSTVIAIDIYNVQNMEYPNSNQWDDYDGIIIPGSFNAAYDTDPWILQLQHVIQTYIVPYHRKTLGICFGHQIMAHSFSYSKAITDTTYCAHNGLAIPTPSGPRAGRFPMPLTSVGKKLFVLDNNNDKHRQESSNTENYATTTTDIADEYNNNNNGNGNATINSVPSVVDLYFTHGDMVSTIPQNVAIALGGNDSIPFQSVAYFASKYDMEQYINNHSSTTMLSDSLPYAITFQAHPEYSTSIELGIHRTLFQCMDAMELRRQHQEEEMGTVDKEPCTAGQKSMTTTKRNYTIQSREDAINHFSHVQNDSISIIARVGQIFGWWY